MNRTIFTPVGMEPDAAAIEQLDNCLKHERAISGALMGDHHLGYAMPIGGVIAYQDAISPTGVGFDIACGNKAIRTDFKVSDLGEVKPWMRLIQKKISFGLGRANADPIDHELFDDEIWKSISSDFNKGLKDRAHDQLGTVGSGNHYVDLLYDDQEYIWIACHFGSRGLGHTLASGFMAAAQGSKFTDRLPESEEPIVLNTDEELGQYYIEAMRLAGDYAYAGRDYVIDQVLSILGNPGVTMEVHNHHNFAWLEDGLWVVRKGATPLTHTPAFIGGSMGDISVIVKGATAGGSQFRWTEVEDIGNLGSAPHGAGRVMSRNRAAGKLRKMWVCQGCNYQRRPIPGVDGKLPICDQCGTRAYRKARVRDKSTAAIDWDIARQELTNRGIVVLGAGADESPGVYKPLSDVLASHSNIKILHTLQPLGVVMAGENERDPYRD